MKADPLLAQLRAEERRNRATFRPGRWVAAMTGAHKLKDAITRHYAKKTKA